MTRETYVKLRAQRIENLSSNLRFFSRKIAKGSDRYNKFWRQLIAESLEHYANEIDGPLKVFKPIRETESNNGATPRRIIG